MTHPDAGALLKLAEEAFEFIRLKLVTDLEEPQRSAFWKAVEMRDNLRQAASQGSAGGEVPICCYCDNTLCCAHCGKEQPADASPPVKTGGGERSAVQSGGAWSCGTCGDADVPEKFRVFGSCYRCAAQRSIDKRNRKVEQLKAREVNAALGAAQGVKDPILTPRYFLDDILSACDASNWDADRNKGDYYRGLNDAYEVILNIAVEYQTSIYAWCKREASTVSSADCGGGK